MPRRIEIGISSARIEEVRTEARPRNPTVEEWIQISGQWDFPKGRLGVGMGDLEDDRRCGSMKTSWKLAIGNGMGGFA